MLEFITMYIYEGILVTVYIYIYKGVSYRQCGNIKRRRGPTEAICLHENKRPTEATGLQAGVAIWLYEKVMLQLL